jgi:hypothetical protein
MRGGQFTGMLAYDARGGTHPRGLRVRLIEVATGWAGDAFASVERVLGEVGTASVPESAEPVPFAIRVSAEERITFDAQIISLRHIIEAEADLAQRKNPKMGVHVRII